MKNQMGNSFLGSSTIDNKRFRKRKSSQIIRNLRGISKINKKNGCSFIYDGTTNELINMLGGAEPLIKNQTTCASMNLSNYNKSTSEKSIERYSVVNTNKSYSQGQREVDYTYDYLLDSNHERTSTIRNEEVNRLPDATPTIGDIRPHIYVTLNDSSHKLEENNKLYDLEMKVFFIALYVNNLIRTKIRYLIILDLIKKSEQYLFEKNLEDKYKKDAENAVSPWVNLIQNSTKIILDYVTKKENDEEKPHKILSKSSIEVTAKKRFNEAANFIMHWSNINSEIKLSDYSASLKSLAQKNINSVKQTIQNDDLYTAGATSSRIKYDSERGFFRKLFWDSKIMRVLKKAEKVIARSYMTMETSNIKSAICLGAVSFMWNRKGYYPQVVEDKVYDTLKTLCKMKLPKEKSATFRAFKMFITKLISYTVGQSIMIDYSKFRGIIKDLNKKLNPKKTKKKESLIVILEKSMEDNGLTKGLSEKEAENKSEYTLSSLI